MSFNDGLIILMAVLSSFCLVTFFVMKRKNREVEVAGDKYSVPIVISLIFLGFYMLVQLLVTIGNSWGVFGTTFSSAFIWTIHVARWPVLFLIIALSAKSIGDGIELALKK